jgi:hypothetical protein
MNRLIAWLSRRTARVGFLDFVLALNLKRCLPVPFRYMAIVSPSLVMLLASAAHAQTTLKYLVIPASTSVISSPTTYTLPGYGQVRVSWTASSPPLLFNRQDESTAYNQSAGGYTWTTDTQDVGIFNPTGATVSYAVTFSFQQGQPDLSKLVLVVIGLASGTTATVSQNVSLAGEFQFHFAGRSNGGHPQPRRRQRQRDDRKWRHRGDVYRQADRLPRNL